MSKISYFLIEDWAGTETEWISLENPEGYFMNMPKSVYDEQQAALKDAANQASGTIS